ncbi:hypothetical protein HU200_000125 [Digitaria exilis]|uniref:Uncharacterized protein n=1 Tax=Digitaria exilis TaxID=1010633 RepID=A0A835G3I5_9POAL|nr:hypothetical protein HU200_000125 [Digitaria exilis]
MELDDRGLAQASPSPTRHARRPAAILSSPPEMGVKALSFSAATRAMATTNGRFVCYPFIHCSSAISRFALSLSVSPSPTTLVRERVRPPNLFTRAHRSVAQLNTLPPLNPSSATIRGLTTLLTKMAFGAAAALVPIMALALFPQTPLKFAANARGVLTPIDPPYWLLPFSRLLRPQPLLASWQRGVPLLGGDSVSNLYLATDRRDRALPPSSGYQLAGSPRAAPLDFSSFSRVCDGIPYRMDGVKARRWLLMLRRQAPAASGDLGPLHRPPARRRCHANPAVRPSPPPAPAASACAMDFLLAYYRLCQCVVIVLSRLLATGATAVRRRVSRPHWSPHVFVRLLGIFHAASFLSASGGCVGRTLPPLVGLALPGLWPNNRVGRDGSLPAPWSDLRTSRDLGSSEKEVLDPRICYTQGRARRRPLTLGQSRRSEFSLTPILLQHRQLASWRLELQVNVQAPAQMSRSVVPCLALRSADATAHHDGLSRASLLPLISWQWRQLAAASPRLPPACVLLLRQAASDVLTSITALLAHNTYGHHHRASPPPQLAHSRHVDRISAPKRIYKGKTLARKRLSLQRQAGASLQSSTRSSPTDDHAMVNAAASAAGFVDLLAGVITLEIFFLLDPQSAGAGTTTTPSPRAPLLDSALGGLLVPLGAAGALFTAAAVIYRRHMVHAAVPVTGAAAAIRRLRLSEVVVFIMCVAAGVLDFFFFVQPAGGAEDHGAQAARALGMAAHRALPTAATAAPSPELAAGRTSWGPFRFLFRSSPLFPGPSSRAPRRPPPTPKVPELAATVRRAHLSHPFYHHPSASSGVLAGLPAPCLLPVPESGSSSQPSDFPTTHGVCVRLAAVSLHSFAQRARRAFLHAHGVFRPVKETNFQERTFGLRLRGRVGILSAQARTQLQEKVGPSSSQRRPRKANPRVIGPDNLWRESAHWIPFLPTLTSPDSNRHRAMNPDTQLVLEELSKLNKRFDDVESKLESRFTDHEVKWETRLSSQEDSWERRFSDLSVAQDARLSTLERAAASFDVWRPDIEGVVDTVRLEVGKLSKHWERSVMDREAPILETVIPAAGRPSAAGEADRPHGHRVDSVHREGVYGSVTTVEHPSEVVSLVGRRKDVKRFDYSYHSKQAGGSPLPLPSPPKLKALVPEDLRLADGAHPRSADDRWRALRAHHHVVSRRLPLGVKRVLKEEGLLATRCRTQHNSKRRLGRHRRSAGPGRPTLV